MKGFEIVAGFSIFRLPFGVTKEPGREDDQDTIENCERKGASVRPARKGEAERGGQRTEKGEDQPNVPPSVLEPHIQRGVILITNRDRTVPTKRGFDGIIQVPAKVLNEIASPGRTCLAKRWVENREFLRVTGDFEAAIEGCQGESCLEGGRETYCNSVVSIEEVILTQGFNWYSHTRNQF